MIYNISKEDSYTRDRPLVPKLHYKKEYLDLKFEFNDSVRQVVNQINKLYGISWIYHHLYSHRIGWMYNPSTDLIDIYHYYYNRKLNKTFNSQYINSIHIGYQYHLNIYYNYSNNTIEVFNDIKINRIPFVFPKCKLGSHCYPYFENCPNDFSVDLIVDYKK